MSDRQAQTSPAASIERIYVLDGGIARAPDLSIYSPGIGEGEPVELSCTAYLIRHRGAWAIWDTGLDDDLARLPDGEIVAHNIRGILKRTLSSQLDEIGVRPCDVATILLSHAHFDHVGNTRLFPQARWIVQKIEHEAMFGSDWEKHGFVPNLYATMRDNPVELVSGDHDVFGDGSVRMIFTPGHTPGHCSLLVRLPKTGPVVLSGDVAHFEDNFRNRRVPTINADAAATCASMDKVAALLDDEGARLWINHDTAQNAAIPHAPSWVE